ncbi:lysosomal Pro-X carboxypeptidase isoform X1 [Tachypleus tridentatus]|uniref:lysosomal Pro-X carboxypeptidase isoform X1 n=1 Tax=Tachypleus tridentatus TaxID=6853 RepID=UPI003FD48342
MKLIWIMLMLNLSLIDFVQNTSSLEYKILYFKQKVDHFGYVNSEMYMQRYIIADKHWRPGGPMFFYTGNEGDIFMFVNNTGLMWDWAQKFKAMLVFAEHRYYGNSIPYRNKSYDELQYLGYLTSEQALADFVTLITYLKLTIKGAADIPVVAFGGSYGGMLSAWLRLKYPHIVIGALSSSAPLLQFTGLTPCGIFSEIVTKDFVQVSPTCVQLIKDSWIAVRRVGKTDKGLKWLTTRFNLCSSLTHESLEDFISWLKETWQFLAMTDYPYPTSFLVPLPAYPIKAACQHLSGKPLDERSLLLKIYKAVSVFQNYTGDIRCFNISQTGGQSLGERGWDFQSCTEMVMPMCSDGRKDMFEPNPWNLTQYAQKCSKDWGVTPEPYKIQEMFGGRNISFGSNIIFSNGLLDPWSGGGILKSLSESLVAIIIPGATHHLDLRSANSRDPPSVIKARYLEEKIIKKWLHQARSLQ